MAQKSTDPVPVIDLEAIKAIFRKTIAEMRITDSELVAMFSADLLSRWTIDLLQSYTALRASNQLLNRGRWFEGTVGWNTNPEDVRTAFVNQGVAMPHYIESALTHEAGIWGRFRHSVESAPRENVSFTYATANELGQVMNGGVASYVKGVDPTRLQHIVEKVGWQICRPSDIVTLIFCLETRRSEGVYYVPVHPALESSNIGGSLFVIDRGQEEYAKRVGLTSRKPAGDDMLIFRHSASPV